jgi:hypothetical protein
MCVRLETQKTPRRCELAGGLTGSERVFYSRVVQGRSRCCAAVVSCVRWDTSLLERAMLQASCQIVHTAAEPVELATIVSRPPLTVGYILTESTNSYDVIHDRYSITWPPVYIESYPQFEV